MTRPLEHALQYVYTSGACAAFAGALASLHEGAELVGIEDAGERDHIVVRLADGSLADAQGRRDLAEITASFGFAAPIATRDIANPPPVDDHHEALVGHLVALGWREAIPAAADHPPLEDAFEDAKDAFDALGGWNGDPAAMLRRCTAALETRA